MYLIAGPTGTGKTTAAAEHVGRVGLTCWLTDRHEDVDAAVMAIEAHGREVGCVLPLKGKQNGEENCLHPDKIEWWQKKGWNYRTGFCPREQYCERQAHPGECPFLASIDNLKFADTVVCTKAMARRSGFFSSIGNPKRLTVVMDEDPVGLLRQAVTIGRIDLLAYGKTLSNVAKAFADKRDGAALAEALYSESLYKFCWAAIARQPPNEQPEAVEVPVSLRQTKAVLKSTKRDRKKARKRFYAAFHKLMRKDPVGTVRNVTRDLYDLVVRAAAGTCFVTAEEVVFHVKLSIPMKKRVFILDATANPDLLRPIVAPRRVEVLCDEPVQPAGRVIQFMDSNGPRSYLNKIPKKPVKIIDAIGDLHPQGKIVLISHASCVEKLAKASKHAERMRTAYFGALRGRNDLEPSQNNCIACHIVIGSPKTTEEARRQLALAVYGKAILPFVDLVTVRRPVVGFVPREWSEGDNHRNVWEARLKGYQDERMAAVYAHTVTAELTHAADRARVLIHRDARVYLVTNEPCPRLWFAELCYAGDFLDLSNRGRADFEAAYETYAVEAKRLLDAGNLVCNADVCRAFGRPGTWGHRYWKWFRETNKDALEGEKKVKWKPE